LLESAIQQITAEPDIVMTDSGYGQQTPLDGTSQAAAVAFIARQLISRLNTMKLVQVSAVHGGGVGNPPPTVDVQLLVSQIDGGGNSVPQGIVYGLQTLRLQSGNNAIVLDPQVNDIGYVICADRDSSAAIRAKGMATPGSGRMYDIADGIYIGAILGAAPTCYIYLASNGYVTIHDVAGNVLQTSSSGITITPASGQKVTIAGNLQVNGSINSTGNITANDIDLETHLHTGVTTGSGNTGPPTG
jgi:hypothetical protein